jgi:hypothetical protein
MIRRMPPQDSDYRGPAAKLTPSGLRTIGKIQAPPPPPNNPPNIRTIQPLNKLRKDQRSNREGDKEESDGELQ